MLARTLMALFRVPEMPADLLPESLQDQPAPITFKVAQYDTAQNLTDFWSSLDNEMRPAIVCMVTMALNPYQPIYGSIVRTRELRFGQSYDPALSQTLVKAAGADTYWTVGGTLRSQEPLEAGQGALNAWLNAAWRLKSNRKAVFQSAIWKRAIIRWSVLLTAVSHSVTRLRYRHPITTLKCETSCLKHKRR